jgi:hypothetical protein
MVQMKGFQRSRNEIGLVASSALRFSDDWLRTDDAISRENLTVSFRTELDRRRTMTRPIHFSRPVWALFIMAATAPVLVDCSRVGTPAPAPVSDAAPAPPASDAASAPLASDSASAPVPSASFAAKPSPAPTVSTSDTPRSPGTARSACARDDDTPGISAEDRARSRATCEAKEEMRAFVAARQACSSASDCTNVGGSCPFGCFLAVSKRSASEVSAKLEELASRLDKAGNPCAYRCMGAPVPACVAGRCTTGTP